MLKKKPVFQKHVSDSHGLFCIQNVDIASIIYGCLMRISAYENI